MFSKILRSFGASSFFMLLVLLMPFTVQAELNQAYQNCLCRCGCQADGWDCSAVSCTFNTTDYDGSPSCAEAANGPCLCEGFGCGRAPIVTSGDCYDSCQVHLTAETCDGLADEYTTVKADYLEKLNTHQELTNFEYRLIANIQNNTMKMGMEFIYSNLLSSSPSKSVSELTHTIIRDIVNNNLFGSEQDKIAIQANMMAAYTETEAKRALLRSQQAQKMAELQGIVNSMKQAECSYDTSEALPVLPTTDLSDVPAESPRDLKVKALNRLGVVNGYPDGTYQPEKKINRAEFIKILVGSTYPDEVDESADEDSSKQNCFSDVGSDWYAKYVCVAKQKGIVEGYGDGTFGPNADINAVEALKIIMETLHPDKVGDAEGEWWQKYWDSAEDMDVVVEDLLEAGQFVNRGQMAEMIFTAMSEDIVDFTYEAEDDLELVDLDAFLEFEGYVCDEEMYEEGDVEVPVDNEEIVPEDTMQDDDSDVAPPATEETTPDDSADLETEDSAEVFPNTFTKSGEYSFTYPDGWELTEENDTHKILTSGNTKISITESGYDYATIQSLIMDDYMAREDAVDLFQAEDYAEEVDRDVYVIVFSYTLDGETYVGEKIVVPNNKGTHNIWELETPYDEFEGMSALLAQIFGTWEMEL